MILAMWNSTLQWGLYVSFGSLRGWPPGPDRKIMHGKIKHIINDCQKIITGKFKNNSIQPAKKQIIKTSRKGIQQKLLNSHYQVTCQAGITL
jgi:hypothetical protein